MKRFLSAIIAFMMGVFGMAKAEEYRMEELNIEKEDGSIIAGWLYVPNGEGSFPTVVLCHGFNGSYKNVTGYAQYLANRGYLCYVFDFCGGGTTSQSSGATTDMTLLTELDDLEQVMSFLTECVDEVDVDKVVISGESQGGFLSALYAAKHPDNVQAAMLLYPALTIPDDARAKFPEGTEIPETVSFLGMQVSGKYYEIARSMDAWTEIAAFEKPVLLVHGTDDKLVPYSSSEKALTIYKNAKLVPIDGAGHGFYLDDREKACEAMFAFLQDNGIQ